MKLEFFHGRLIGGFEQIANEEGKTFGDDAEFFEDIAHAHNILKFNGYLTEAQADAICQKLQAQLDSSIKPLKEEKRETENENYDVNSAIFHVFAIGFKAGKNGEDLFSAYNYFFEKLNLEEQQNDSKSQGKT